MKGYLSFLLKGAAMGLSDSIPGISGGTIAFITGIYERLMTAIQNYTPKNLVSLTYEHRHPKHWSALIKKLDVPFLLPLVIGLLGALYISSSFVPYLLENHFVLTMSFFIGLILASGYEIFKHIRHHTKINHILAFVGLAIGIAVAFLIPVNVPNSFPILFISGFIAICAMFLPGISGAFILLILGQYTFVLSAIHNIGTYFWHLVVFGIGAIFGALLFSRFITYLFSEWKSRTLYFLLGLVIGSLSVPILRISQTDFVWSLSNSLLFIILFIVGVLITVGLTKLGGK